MLLKVTKCTKSSNGGYVLTLQNATRNASIQTPFGLQESKSFLTYYMKVEDAVEEGFTAEINIGNYNIVERPFTTSDGTDITMKWLHVN